MRKKSFTAVILGLALLLGLSACGPRARKGSVYWLNDDPERNAAALALADRYEQEKGIAVKVITPGEGEYAARLAAEMKRRDAPTLFSLAGEEELADWQPSCLELRSTALGAALRPEARLLRGENESVYGLGHDVASFGLIVNTGLLARAGYRPEEIASFDDLRRVSEDIQARSDALGFTAFTSSGLEEGSSWRFTRQLFSLAAALEYLDRPETTGQPIRGSYMQNYRALLDLYLENTACDAATLRDRDLEDARAEFLAGKAAFYQNGSWEYEALRAGGMDGKTLTMIPLYLGKRQEEDLGLCSDVTGYWCLNQNAAAENLQATEEFLLWCASDPEAARTLGLEEVFFDPATVENPFIRAEYALVAAGKQPVDWAMDALPDDRWEKECARLLGEYAAARDEESWEAARAALVDEWAERAGRGQ